MILAIALFAVLGGLAGFYGVRELADQTGLLEVERALLVPLWLLGIVAGSVAGIVLAMVTVALRWSIRQHGRTSWTILGALGATVLGAAGYLTVTGLVVWLVGLVLSDRLTWVLSVLLSLGGLPFVGPVAYALLGGRWVTRGGADGPGVDATDR